MLQWYRTNTDVEVHLPELSTYLGHVHVRDTYWYLSAVPELLHWPHCVCTEGGRTMKTQSTFSELLQAYFTQRLMHECNASPHTIANIGTRSVS